MKYPNAVRSNLRYRGPIESKKLNDISSQLDYNLTELYKYMQELEVEYQELKDILNDDNLYKTKRQLHVTCNNTKLFSNGGLVNG